MIVGIALMLLGIVILHYPRILVFSIAGLFIMTGLGLVTMSWRFRRFHRRSQSRVVNWMMRF